MIGLMPDTLNQDMLRLATDLAEQAAAIALPRLGQTTVTRKADNSPVTEIDNIVQSHIVAAISGAYPDHAVCAEETLEQTEARPAPADTRYCWVIDPIDGTRNYASGLPCFSTSIAVLDRGLPVVGVVMEHNLGHSYAAVAGRGATFDKKPVHVKEVPVSSDVLIGTPSSKGKVTVKVLSRWVATRGLILRNLGSTALHLAMVASGVLNAAFSCQCKIWDIAAGALLIAEAGGRVTDLEGAPRAPFDLSVDPDENLPVLAAGPRVHERLLDSIRAATA